MLPPYRNQAEPTTSVPPTTADAESSGHRHGPSCYWQIDEAQWSCELLATHREPREAR
jgi:hypothetical protein